MKGGKSGKMKHGKMKMRKKMKMAAGGCGGTQGGGRGEEATMLQYCQMEVKMVAGVGRAGKGFHAVMGWPRWCWRGLGLSTAM